jgi:hypothetical protein
MDHAACGESLEHLLEYFCLWKNPSTNSCSEGWPGEASTLMPRIKKGSTGLWSRV